MASHRTSNGWVNTTMIKAGEWQIDGTDYIAMRKPNTSQEWVLVHKHTRWRYICEGYGLNHVLVCMTNLVKELSKAIM